LADSDDARDQDDNRTQKRNKDKQLLDKMNTAIISEFGQDNLEGNPEAQKVSLRNQFFY
jgi:hypothetical protein